MSRFRGLRLALSVVTVIAAVAAVLASASLGSLQAQSFSATLSPIAGVVQVLVQGETDWKNVVETTLINQGDQIRTGNDGLARLNVVTGISVDIHPTTWVEVDDLALGEGDNSALTYSLFQLVGRTYVYVDQELNPDDRVQVIYPTVGIVVTGTKFFNFIHPNLNAFVMVEEGETNVEGAELPNVTVTPENALYVEFDLPQPVPQVCTLDLLRTAIQKREITEIRPNNAGIEALRRHLVEAVTGQVNLEVRPYMRALLGLPPVDLAKLTQREDVDELTELLNAIPTFDGDGMELIEFLADYREFWQVYFSTMSSTPLAPETCGNGEQDDGETAQNCATDFADPQPCGNGLCEVDRMIQGDLGESVINCPADCLPYPDLARSCGAILRGIIGRPLPQVPTPSGVGVGGRPLSATLSGGSVVPAGSGDPDARGLAQLTLNQGQGQVCFGIGLQNVDTVTVTAINAGAAGTNGPISVNLGGQLSGCVNGVDGRLIQDIRQNPGNYYVNVGTSGFPNGALRGQLSR